MAKQYSAEYKKAWSNVCMFIELVKILGCHDNMGPELSKLYSKVVNQFLDVSINNKYA